MIIQKWLTLLLDHPAYFVHKKDTRSFLRWFRKILMYVLKSFLSLWKHNVVGLVDAQPT